MNLFVHGLESNSRGRFYRNATEKHGSVLELDTHERGFWVDKKGSCRRLWRRCGNGGRDTNGRRSGAGRRLVVGYWSGGRNGSRNIDGSGAGSG